MSILNENQLLGASGAGGDYEIEQSLRFNDDDNAYLSRTPSSAGNRRTFTYSVWIKRGNLGTQQRFFSAASSSSYEFHLQFYQDKLQMWNYSGSSPYPNLETTQLFRDSSAWYHIVATVDTTNSTANDRMRFYVNGVRITALNVNANPDLNYQFIVNESGIENTIGSRPTYYTQPMDGYMGEVNFIDGQALTPDSFGETGDYGEWKPKAYAGTYGTNGFYLPFEQDYAVEGFSTVTYEGNGASSHYIGGTGFTPDFTWIKKRSNTADHRIFDSVRGVTKSLKSNATQAEGTESQALTAFNTDGFTLGTDDYTNGNGSTFVAWNWDMGGTTASNTDGTITSSVRANTAYGQSIVSYTGNGNSNVSIGHGLGQIPDIVIIKPRGRDDNWVVSGQYIGAEHDYIYLNATGAAGGAANTRIPNADANNINLGTFWNNINTSGIAHIAYCFSSVTGYSKIGSYSGNGSSTGPVVTLGFSPAFLLAKRTDSTGNWFIWDSTRDTDGVFNTNIHPNSTAAESNSGSNFVTTSGTGFQLTGTGAETNASGGTYIYMAFADTREYAYWYDQSGNNNDWTSNDLTESDVMVDSPTNNFATWNPLDNGGNTLSEGNLVLNVSSGFKLTRSTFFADSGKWYWEVLCTDSGNGWVGVSTAVESLTSRGSETSSSVNIATSDGDSRTGAATSSYGSAFSDGDIMMLALDMDNGKFYAGKNGTWFNSGNPATSTNPAKTGLTTALSPSISLYDNEDYNTNFGSDSSFAGAKTPQGHSDSGGIGDFHYAPPNSYLALCTANLPDATVIPSEHFNTVLYTGNGSSTHAITNVGFTPDWVWAKQRNTTRSHRLLDSVRGAGVYLASDNSNAESSASGLFKTFDSDGFTLDAANALNQSGGTYVAWNWKLGGSAVSNTNGSATSQVSANVDAGISIATFTLPTTAQTIGHGLSKAPELIIHKGRVSGSAWWTFHKDIGNTSAVRLDATSAAGASTNFWNNTDPTSTVVTIGANSGGNNSWMMYCFHSVDGYSKVGSFVGNGSETAGPFVHCGFKPKFVLVKRATAVGSWFMFDTDRSPYNVMNAKLSAENSGAEDSDTSWNIDFLSNGFKLRSPHVYMNSGSNTHVFLAFAESPFKHSNAR